MEADARCCVVVATDAGRREMLGEDGGRREMLPRAFCFVGRSLLHRAAQEC